MRLLLLRHGRATGGHDGATLTAGGRADVARALRHPALAELGAPLRLAHSPLRRAVETADLVVRALAAATRSEEPALRPESDPAAAGRRLATLGEGAGALVAVGHLPLLPELARWFVEEPLPFAPGHGWLLEAEHLWQGSARILTEIDHAAAP